MRIETSIYLLGLDTLIETRKNDRLDKKRDLIAKGCECVEEMHK